MSAPVSALALLVVIAKDAVVVKKQLKDQKNGLVLRIVGDGFRVQIPCTSIEEARELYRQRVRHERELRQGNFVAS